MVLGLACKVARAIYDEAQRWGDDPRRGDVLYIGADGQPTYRFDDALEKEALQVLEGESVALLSEEAGYVELCENPEYLCVLDPLDGSTNAVSGIPFYCTSVAFAPWKSDPRLQNIEASVVMNLLTGDLFTAEKDIGAMLNHKAINCSSETGLKSAMATLYLSSDYHMIHSFGKVRALGAVALEMAHLAAGSLNVIMDNRNRLKVTDVAAAKLLVEEAGGVISDLKGNVLNPSTARLEELSLLAVGSRELHERVMTEVLG